MQLNKSLKFDVIIIGAGISSFASAIILQKFFKKKTALVTGLALTPDKSEKNIHVDSFYSGQMESDSFVRKIFDYLTDDKLLWERLPSIYERHFYPKARLNISDNLAQYMDGLKNLFPKEKGNVDSFFKDIQHAANYTSFYLLRFILPPTLHKITERFFVSGKKFAALNSEDYLNSLSSDSKFKTVISGQLQNLASCREGTTSIFQAINMMGLLNGGFAPAGGINAIYNSLKTSYLSSGGKLFENGTIEDIVISGRRVKEIKINTTDEKISLRAGKVFWGSGIKALPEYVTDTQTRERLKGCFPIHEFVPFPVVFKLQFNEKSEKINLKGEILRFFPANSADPDEIPQACNLYPWFPENSHSTLPAGYFAVIFINGDDPESFLAQSDNIDDLKKYLDQLMRLYVPELPDCIEAIEFVTPSSSGTGGLYNPFGTVMPTTQKVMREPVNNPYKLKNLFVTGADLFIPGITPSVMSGITTVGMAFGAFRFFKFFRYLKKVSNKKVKIKIKPLKYKNGKIEGELG